MTDLEEKMLIREEARQEGRAEGCEEGRKLGNSSLNLVSICEASYNVAYLVTMFGEIEWDKLEW